MVTLSPSRKPLTQPVYQRIEADLRERIALGAWLPGAPLPSRAALAREYGIGLATLERAMSGLLADGSVVATPGQHTVVGIKSGSHDARPMAALDVKPSVLGVISYEPIGDEPHDHYQVWLYQVAHCIERSFLQAGGVTIFKSAKPKLGESQKRLRDLVIELRDEGVQTIVVIDLVAAFDVAQIQELSTLQARDGTLIVHVSHSDMDATIPHVYYDSAYRGRQAVQHLMSRGFDRFTYVSPYRFDWSLHRCQQARDMAIHAGLGTDALTPLFGEAGDRLIGEHHADLQMEHALAFGRDLFSRRDFPKCIIAANDYTAFGLMEASHERGLMQGIDYAIIGFDDEVMSLRYGLTTFRPPIEEIGNEAALLLNRLMRGEDCSLQVRLRSRLVARASTLKHISAPVTE